MVSTNKLHHKKVDFYYSTQEAIYKGKHSTYRRDGKPIKYTQVVLHDDYPVWYPDLIKTGSVDKYLELSVEEYRVENTRCFDKQSNRCAIAHRTKSKGLRLVSYLDNKKPEKSWVLEKNLVITPCIVWEGM